MDTTYRRGTLQDGRTLFDVFARSFNDFDRRNGRPMMYPTPADADRMWERWRTLLTFLATNTEQFWVAEKKEILIGFARSILADDV